jgi:hypothetical protein
MTTSGIRKTIELQYEKAGSILTNTIERYDDELWMAADGYSYPAWRVAYHAVYFTNIYCSPTEESISAWPHERENYQILGRTPWPPYELVVATEPYSRAEIGEYLCFVLEAVPGYLEGIEPEADCWPFWYDENQLEFHFNNLRHLQHHTAELIERHDIATGFSYPWQ